MPLLLVFSRAARREAAAALRLSLEDEYSIVANN
jgi:hypothetical protein